MTPYFQRDGVTLYNADCREILPTIEAGSVDLVLTDPPYGIDGGSGLGAERGKGDYASDFIDDSEHLRLVVVPVIRELIRQCGSVVLTPGNKNFCLYPQPDSFGAFYQPAAVGLQTFGNLDAQPIFYYGKNASKKVMGVPCSYVLTEAPIRNGHPCPKPFRAWKKLLDRQSSPGQTVLDPFAGSGTTLRAAMDLGRKAIGIEISEKYCEIAARRLEQRNLQFAEAM